MLNACFIVEEVTTAENKKMQCSIVWTENIPHDVDGIPRDSHGILTVSMKLCKLHFKLSVDESVPNGMLHNGNRYNDNLIVISLCFNDNHYGLMIILL